MTARILRRTKAAQDTEDIADHIAKEGLHIAIRFLENTEATLQLLAEFPSIGSPFTADHKGLENLRTCRVNGFPNHVVFYIEHHDSIEVVRVLHGARDVDAELRNN